MSNVRTVPNVPGNEKCKGRQGEIHKLNCKDEKPAPKITCCCAIKCESEVKTKEGPLTCTRVLVH